MNPLHLMDSKRYERILRQAAAAHFTMIRWWGGGVPERPAFYEWCDRLGLMVYQDFFLANNEHDNEPFLQDARRTGGRVRATAAESPLYRPMDRRETNCSTAMSTTMRRRNCGRSSSRMDPTRPFSPSSPAIGVKHAITDYFYRPETGLSPRSIAYGPDPELRMKIRGGEFPDWSIIGQPHNSRLSGMDRPAPKRLGFDPDMTRPIGPMRFDIQLTAEGGAATVANAATLRTDSSHPKNGRDFNPVEASPPRGSITTPSRAAMTGCNMPRLSGSSARSTTPMTYAVFAQFSRGQIIRYGLEEMRRRKFRTSGTLMWQLNETWPNAAGNAIVDYFGRPRATYDAVRTAYAPVHASLRFDKIHLEGRGDSFSAGRFFDE